jgi:A/G-specific adenine glycosylase
MLSTLLRRTASHETIRAVAKDTNRVDRVCAWFERSARPLPWRDTSPWGVLVSEFMLQQTPVKRVEPVWRVWMERWPEPAALAAEPAGEAVRAWGRLGYPRRALRLHATAIELTAEHGGSVPSSEAELRALPGVGEYTAAAIRAFAFGESSVVLDVNVRRVISRAWSGIDEPPSHMTAMERALAEGLASAASDTPAWAAASMELGALVCTKVSPDCGSCPLQRSCVWRKAGFPPLEAKPRRQPRFEGSDRQARGRIMRALREADKPVSRSRLISDLVDGKQGERALASLEADGLVVRVGRNFALPD